MKATWRDGGRFVERFGAMSVANADRLTAKAKMRARLKAAAALAATPNANQTRGGRESRQSR